MTRSDLLKFIRLLSRRRWLIAAVSLTTFVLVVAWALLMPLYYRATTVVIPSEAAQKNPLGLDTVTMTDGYRIDQGTQINSQTLFMGIAKSQEVLQLTRNKLGWKMSTREFGKLVSLEPAYAAAFNITMMSRDKAEAIRAANTLADTLREYYAVQRQYQAERQLNGLEERATKLKYNMESAKADLASLQDQQVTLTSIDGQNDPLLKRAAELQAEFDAIRSQRADLSERRRRTQEELNHQPSQISSETSTSDTPRTAALQSEMAQLTRDLSVAQSRYTDKHPEVIRLRERIEQTRNLLNRARNEMESHRTYSPNPTKSMLQSDLVKLKIEEGALAARMEQIQKDSEANRQKMRGSSNKTVLLAARMADYQAAVQAYQEISRLLQTVRIEANMSQVNGDAPELQIIHRANNAVGPDPLKGPAPAQLIMVGLLLSLFLGVGAAVALDTLDTSLRSAEEVQELLRLPLSATIPQVLGEERKALPRITRALPISPYAECYRFLRASILGGGYREEAKCMQVTAVAPGHGSTTTSANLALSLAETGRSVVLVDADLRRPRQHTAFGVSNEIGLTTVLSTGLDVEKVLQPTDVDGLVLLPAGPVPDNPSLLLNSAKMRQTLDKLRERFDFILVDTPPVLAFSDSSTVSSLVDGTVLVVRVGGASKGNELQAKIALEKAGAKILGVVVNGLEAQQIDSFHYHAHYYQQPALPAPVELPIEGEIVQ